MKSKLAEKVKEFYRLMEEGKTYPTVWADTVVEFDQKAAEKVQHIVDMKKKHDNKKCVCGKICDVRQTQSNANKNRGRWYWICPDREDRNNHYFEWISK